MEKLSRIGTMYRLNINGKDVNNEVETIYQIEYSKDIIKVIAVFNPEQNDQMYGYDDAIIHCKNKSILDFKIDLLETDFICYQGKCIIKKISKHYPDQEAVKFKITFEVI